MHSRLTALTIVAASVIGATITSGERAAMAGPSWVHEGPVVGAAGGSPAVSAGLELAQGAGGAEPEVTASHEEDDEATPALACPRGMVLVQGEHCYFNEQVCLRWNDPEGRPSRRVCAEFKEPTRCASRRHSMQFCMDQDEFVAAGETLPTVGVSWESAQAKCEELGKRLCTDLEWEFACEGEDGLPYPYGYERSPSLCNQDRVVRDGEKNARGDLREPPHPSCVSPFGIRDMVGNVDEWVTRPHEKPPHRSELRGGWWVTGRNRCRAATTSHDERYAGRQTGFRCCRDRSPSDYVSNR